MRFTGVTWAVALPFNFFLPAGSPRPFDRERWG